MLITIIIMIKEAKTKEMINTRYKNQLTSYPQLFCIDRAKDLLEANICFQDLELALSYYQKYLQEETAVRDSKLDQLSKDMTLLIQADAYLQQSRFTEAHETLMPLTERGYARVYTMQALIQEDQQSSNGEINDNLQLAIEKGDSYGCYMLGCRVQEGLADDLINWETDDRDTESAKVFEYAALFLNCQYSGMELAKRYELGQGVERSLSRAIDIYEALFRLGKDPFIKQKIIRLRQLLQQELNQPLVRAEPLIPRGVSPSMGLFSSILYDDSSSEENDEFSSRVHTRKKARTLTFD